MRAFGFQIASQSISLRRGGFDLLQPLQRLTLHQISSFGTVFNHTTPLLGSCPSKGASLGLGQLIFGSCYVLSVQRCRVLQDLGQVGHFESVGRVLCKVLFA